LVVDDEECINITSKLGFWDREMEIVGHHHEWLDGTGWLAGRT